MSTRFVRLPELLGAGGRLGRHVVHDPRSKGYALDTSHLTTLRSVRHTRVIPVLDQGDLGSCTGNAMVGALGTSPVWDRVPRAAVLDETLAVAIYSQATRLDDVPGAYPPRDTGSSGLAVCKAAKARGLIGGYSWTFTPEDALRAIMAGPCLLGTRWYESFDESAPDGRIRILRGAEVRGGHEVVLDEIDVDRQLIGFTNSWGPYWGYGGRAYLGWSDLSQLLDEDGDLAVPTPLPAARQPVTPWWTRLWEILFG